MAAEDLSLTELTELCAVAQQAWDDSPPTEKAASFNWRGKGYIASQSTFRLSVETHDGKLVASRYN